MMAAIRRWLSPCRPETQPTTQQRSRRIEALVQHAQAGSTALIKQSFDSVNASQEDAAKMRGAQAAIDELLQRMSIRNDR